MPRHWQQVIESLHSKIEEEEKPPDPDMVGRNYTQVKTPVMRRFEATYHMRLEVALRWERLSCNGYKKQCSRFTPEAAKCFYHRFGVEPRVTKMWRKMLNIDHTNPRCRELMNRLLELEQLAEKNKQVKIPLVLRQSEIRLMVQSLALVPEDLELEI